MPGPSLYVRAPDEGTRIEVLDPALQPIVLPHNAGEAKIDVAPGVYSVRFRRGLALTEKLVIVGKDDEEVRVVLEADEEPVFATAAPVHQMGDPNATHRLAAEKLSRSEPHSIGKPSVDNGRLLLFVRADTETTTALEAGITLHDLNGDQVARVADDGESNPAEGWAGVHYSLAAGPYRVRRQVGDLAFEQIVHIRHEWQTQYFAKAVAGGDGAAADFALLSVMMAHETAGFDGAKEDGRYTESALRALRERSAVSGPVSRHLLDGKFENPLLGILAGLLQLRRKDIDLKTLRMVVDNLLWLVGPSPDVLAIGLGMLTHDPALRDDTAFRDRICNPAILGLPPYFSESWRHICNASQWDPKLTPVNSLAARAAPSITQATPWFRWRVTAETQMPAVAPSTDVVKGGGLLGRVANLVLKSFGVTPKKFEAFTAQALSGLLQQVQTLLSRFDDVPELLQSAEFTDVDRRIAAFVFPLTDPALEAFLSGRKDRSDALREAVLARGRDGREMALALQLPLGTAMLQSAGLGGRINNASRGIPTESTIAAFVERESRGNAELRAALEHLRNTELPIRPTGHSKPLNALAYLVMRYAAPASAPPKLLDTRAGPGTSADATALNEALETARRTLAADVALRIDGGQLRTKKPETGELITPLDRFEIGKLFQITIPAAKAKQKQARKSATTKKRVSKRAKQSKVTKKPTSRRGLAAARKPGTRRGPLKDTEPETPAPPPARPEPA